MDSQDEQQIARLGRDLRRVFRAHGVPSEIQVRADALVRHFLEEHNEFYGLIRRTSPRTDFPSQDS